MKTACPSCGAEIEFRFDDSFVRVCAYCNHAVQRTDRGLETLGRVADLVPIESPLRLFATGEVAGEAFILIGMAQIRHAAGGIWQEWYAKLAGGRWGWLAEAQGRYYLTFHLDSWDPMQSGELAVGRLAPGETIAIGGRAMTVAETTTGTYGSARGELPYRLVPGETFRYADLGDGAGHFATIDFGSEGDGDGAGAPALYIGTQVALADLHLTGGEAAPEAAQIRSKDLTCPSCAAPIQLHAPGDSLRVVCAHCNALLDATGALAVVAKLHQRPQLAIPLGAKGAFAEGELTVIAFLQRSAYVDAAWWEFEEYLLYRPDLGFRWLVQSDGHWSYVQPIEPGAVDVSRGEPVYDRARFRRFQSAPLRVDQVLGEVYWPVKVGETVTGDDFVAPPAMLSRETGDGEETWSLGTYLTAAEVRAAFRGADVVPPHAQGIAPNQPDAWSAASSLMAIAFFALAIVGLVFSMAAKNDRVLDMDLTFKSGAPAAIAAASTDAALQQQALEFDQLLGSQLQQLDDINRAILGSDADAGTNVLFSDPFKLRGGENVEIAFRDGTLGNNWVYVAADLVNQATGEVVDLDGELDYYFGVDDGESWTEGSRTATTRAGPQPAGTYVLRFEGQVGNGTETVHATVRQGVFRGAYLALALLVLGIPLSIVAAISYLHEKRRWENSTAGKAPMTAVGVLVLILAGGFILIGVIVKAMRSRDE